MGVIGFLALLIAIGAGGATYVYFSQQSTKLSAAQKKLKAAEDKNNQKAARLSAVEQQYGPITQKDDVLRRLDTEIQNRRSQVAEINQKGKQQKEGLSQQIATLQEQLKELEEKDFIQSSGFYESKYDFGTAEEYKEKLESIRSEQKSMITQNHAAVCCTSWTVEGSQKKGEKMAKDMIKLFLRAFNGECDAAVLKVKYNNISTLEKRINKSYEALNKLGKVNTIEIRESYLDLKIQELRLVHEYQEKKQAELEEQRQIREQMREEEKARKELEKNQREAEKEEQNYQKALEKARKEAEQAAGKAKDKLQQQIAELQQRLEEAQKNKERATSQAQMTKSGHVYIISNIGSFGDNVFKIGMTRRLEPNDRVKELGDASVPFPFDVHAMIYTQDAPGLEKELHKRFDERRMNKANTRKEFFRVSLDEIAREVRAISPESDLKVTKVAEAVEWRKTLAMEEETVTKN